MVSSEIFMAPGSGCPLDWELTCHGATSRNVVLSATYCELLRSLPITVSLLSLGSLCGGPTSQG